MLHWQNHLDRVQAVLDQPPVALITDIDGTISPIASRPDAATIDPDCRAALEALASRMLVAAVSGRAATDARRLVGIDNLIYIGNHGMDRLSPQGLHVNPDVEPYTAAIRALLREVGEQVTLPGMLLEDKGSTASIHYRQCADQPQARRTILHVVEPLAAASQLVVTEGRLVVEIRPPVKSNKGTAVRNLIEDYELGGAFYLGDDVTDVDAFKALRNWRDEGEGRSLALGVISSETPDIVIETADLHLQGIADVAMFLRWLEARITGQ